MVDYHKPIRYLGGFIWRKGDGVWALRTGVAAPTLAWLGAALIVDSSRGQRRHSLSTTTESCNGVQGFRQTNGVNRRQEEERLRGPE